jgi:hypothetical protein
MGGKAFPELKTPRMSPEAYQLVKSRFHAILREKFLHVATPIEAPAKADYGDLDIMVCEPLQQTLHSLHMEATPGKERANFLTKDIAAMTGATHSKQVGNLESWNFAWPVPSELEQHYASNLDSTSNTLPQDVKQEHNVKIYIQIDIRIHRSLEEYEWFRHMHAHGDFWMIVSQIVREYGLMISEKGFFVLIPEIEGKNRNLSRVLATQDFQRVFDFLGLDKQRFEQPFDSWDNIMDYAATCRFHKPGRGRRSEETSTPSDQPTASNNDHANASNATNAKGGTSDNQNTTKEVSKPDVPASQSNTTSTSSDALSQAFSTMKLDTKLTTWERKRHATRPMYQYYIDVYRPAHIDDPAQPSASMTKADVVTEAKTFFGPDFVNTYDEQRITGIRTTGEINLWTEYRKYLKEQTEESAEQTVAMKGLKREVMIDDADQENEHAKEGGTDVVGAVDEASRVAAKAFRAMDYEAVLAWGKECWKAILGRQQAFDKAKNPVIGSA